MGSAALVLALGAASAFVWMSPTSPVNEAITAAAKTAIAESPIGQQRAEWESEKNALLGEIDELEREISTARDEYAEASAQMTALQQELWSTEGTLNALRTGSGEDSARGDARGAGATAKPSPTPSAPGAVETIVTAPSKEQLLAPASSYFGLYTEQAPFNWATYDDASTKLGSTPNVVGYFGGWDEEFRENAVTRAWQRDTLPILTWESRPIGSANDQVDEPEYTLPLIIGDPQSGIPGSFDEYLRQYAHDIVETGLPLGIRLDHEMNGVWYPWAETDGKGEPINGNRDGDFVAMWHHVYDIFEEEGANDLVIWIWSPNRINNLPASHQSSDFLDALYPGDEYVDWVGLSGYLRPAYKPDDTFSFDYTFGSTLDELRRITDKPIFLTEIGASETGGHKPEWIESLFEALASPSNDDIIGVAWFNLAVTTYVEGERATNDWRVDSRADSLAAFRAGLARPDSNFTLTPR